MSKILTASALDAAERFIWLNARLLDRLRFAHLLRGGAAAPVLAALRPYQNDDGGWTFNRPVWAPVVEPEWRGAVTVEQLKRLRGYGRLAD